MILAVFAALGGAGFEGLGWPVPLGILAGLFAGALFCWLASKIDWED